MQKNLSVLFSGRRKYNIRGGKMDKPHTSKKHLSVILNFRQTHLDGFLNGSATEM